MSQVKARTDASDDELSGSDSDFFSDFDDAGDAKESQEDDVVTDGGKLDAAQAEATTRSSEADNDDTGSKDASAEAPHSAGVASESTHNVVAPQPETPEATAEAAATTRTPDGEQLQHAEGASAAATPDASPEVELQPAVSVALQVQECGTLVCVTLSARSDASATVPSDAKAPARDGSSEAVGAQQATQSQAPNEPAAAPDAVAAVPQADADGGQESQIEGPGSAEGAAEADEGEAEAGDGEEEDGTVQGPASRPAAKERKPLEPYDVPSFGHACFLHDDRLAGRRGRGRGRSRGGRDRGGRLEREATLWEPNDGNAWGHEGFHELNTGDNPAPRMMPDMPARRHEERAAGRGRRTGVRPHRLEGPLVKDGRGPFAASGRGRARRGGRQGGPDAGTAPPGLSWGAITAAEEDGDYPALPQAAGRGKRFLSGRDAHAEGSRGAPPGAAAPSMVATDAGKPHAAVFNPDAPQFRPTPHGQEKTPEQIGAELLAQLRVGGEAQAQAASTSYQQSGQSQYHQPHAHQQAQPAHHYQHQTLPPHHQQQQQYQQLPPQHHGLASQAAAASQSAAEGNQVSQLMGLPTSHVPVLSALPAGMQATSGAPVPGMPGVRYAMPGGAVVLPQSMVSGIPMLSYPQMHGEMPMLATGIPASMRPQLQMPTASMQPHAGGGAAGGTMATSRAPGGAHTEVPGGYAVAMNPGAAPDASGMTMAYAHGFPAMAHAPMGHMYVDPSMMMRAHAMPAAMMPMMTDRHGAVTSQPSTRS